MASTQEKQVSYGFYVFIWLSLLILTGMTVAVAGVKLHFLAVAVALTIASFKTYLVVSYFMHIKYDDVIFRRMLLFMIGTLTVILILTFLDVGYR